MVALCKCGYQKGHQPNPWYTIIENADSAQGETLIARYRATEIDFKIEGYFDTAEEARDHAKERGWPFPRY